MISSLLMFAAIASAVAIVGILLARSADYLGSAFRLDRSITGFIMLAAATSLPELVVSCQVARTGSADMAAASLLGSCLFNLLILAGIDLSRRSRQRMLSRQAAAHGLASLSSILLAALVAFGILLPDMPAFGRLHSASVLLVIAYLVTFRMVYVDRSVAMEGQETPPPRPTPTVAAKWPLIGYGLATAGILALSSPLASSSNAIVVELHLSTTFFGAVFLASVTSLPEVVTTYEASRMNADDLAIGNIIGSNAFNLVILAAVDLFTEKPLFNELSSGLAIAAIGVILTTTVAAMGLLYRVEKRIWYLEPDAVGVIAIALFFFYLLYLL